MGHSAFGATAHGTVNALSPDFAKFFNSRLCKYLDK